MDAAGLSQTLVPIYETTQQYISDTLLIQRTNAASHYISHILLLLR